MSPALSLLATILAFLGAVIAWTFVYLYARPPFHWRMYEAGRHLMRFTAGLATILTWSCVAFVLLYIFGRVDWLLWTIDIGRVVIFGWVVVMLAARLRIILQARHEPPPEGDSRDPVVYDDAPVQDTRSA